MVQHFTKDEVEELRARLSGNSAKDTDFPEAHSFTRSDEIAIVQEGINKKLNLDKLFSGLVRGLDEEFMQNEKTRQTNESIRTANESSRLSAEEDRIASETERKTNETIRIANESARVASETDRETAEHDRSLVFTKLKEQSEAATKNANDAAQTVIDVFTLLSESEYAALEKKDNNKLYLVYEDETEQ